MNARGFGEVGDSEACELAVNPVRAGASSQRAPFSRGREKKKKKGLHTEPWKRRGMGQLCRRSPAPRQADKGRSEEAGESRASGRRRENGNRFPVHATFYFRFAVLRVRTYKSPCSLLRVSDESGDDASARTCIASSANFVFPSVSCQAGF